MRRERYDQYRQIVSIIPLGKVATYGQIAAIAGYPMHAREVGRFLSEEGVDLPWHRVVNAQGHLSLDVESSRQIQRERLEEEGIVIINQRVNLKLYRWLG